MYIMKVLQSTKTILLVILLVFIMSHADAQVKDKPLSPSERLQQIIKENDFDTEKFSILKQNDTLYIVNPYKVKAVVIGDKVYIVTSPELQELKPKKSLNNMFDDLFPLTPQRSRLFQGLDINRKI